MKNYVKKSAHSAISKVGERSKYTVKCKVFNIARRQSRGRAGHLAGHQRRLAQYPRESEFILSLSLFLSLSLSLLFLLWYPALIILHEIAWKRRNSPTDSPRCFATFRNINYDTCQVIHAHGVAAASRISFPRRGIILKGVLKYLKPYN